jgi:hypothetical protein
MNHSSLRNTCKEQETDACGISDRSHIASATIRADPVDEANSNQSHDVAKLRSMILHFYLAAGMILLCASRPLHKTGYVCCIC